MHNKKSHSVTGETKLNPKGNNDRGRKSMNRKNGLVAAILGQYGPLCHQTWLRKSTKQFHYNKVNFRYYIFNSHSISHHEGKLLLQWLWNLIFVPPSSFIIAVLYVISCYTITCYNTLGAVSIRKMVLPGMAIPMLKIRRPNGRLIFNMEIAIRR